MLPRRRRLRRRLRSLRKRFPTSAMSPQARRDSTRRQRRKSFSPSTRQRDRNSRTRRRQRRQNPRKRPRRKLFTLTPSLTMLPLRKSPRLRRKMMSLKKSSPPKITITPDRESLAGKRLRLRKRLRLQSFSR